MENKNQVKEQINLAQEMIKNGNIKGAIAIYNQLTALPHPSASFYKQLGNALEKDDRLEEAIAAYQQAIELRPENVNFYLRQSHLYLQQKRVEPAIEKAEAALQLKADFVPALNQLVTIYEKKNELDQAIYYRQRLVQLQPKNSNSFRLFMDLYAKVLSKTNNIDDVLAAYQQVLKETPSAQIDIAHESFVNLILKVGTRLGCIERVVTFFHEALDAQPNNHWYHYNLGLSLAKQNRLDDAKKSYQAAIQLKPKFWQSILSLGQLLANQSDRESRDKGFQYIIQACNLNPGLSPSFYQSLHLDSPEKWKIFDKTCEKILKNKPGNKFWIGKKLSEKGEFLEAISCYQELLYRRLKKTKPEFVYRYWDSGKLQEPNFLILGVAKCGTTSLYNYLSQHPQFLPAIYKEPQYLKQLSLAPKLKEIETKGDWSLLSEERKFYLAHFPRRPEKGFITGEASTSTIWSKSDKIVKNWFPKIKLITIVRNPINRAVSHYNFHLKRKTISLEEMIKSELQELENMKNLPQKIESLKYVGWSKHLAPGLYVYYLQRWMKLFPREQILVLSNEDLAQDPAGVMKQTFDFLGLPECNAMNYTPRNVGNYPKDLDPNLLSRLQDFYRPHNQKLEEFLGRKFNWD